MPAKSQGERSDRLEQVVQILAEDQLSLQKIVADLATETRRGFDRVAKQFEESERRMRDTEEMLRKQSTEANERSRQIDERIEKLVSAMGEYIRRTDK